MIPRAAAEAAFARAVAENPAREGVKAAGVSATIGLAVGKAAIAMAQGAGPIGHGLVVTPAGAAGELPAGWKRMIASHPEPDETSVAAGAAAVALVRQAQAHDVVLALISGGASALIEEPIVPLGEFRALVAAVMATGAPIDELNAVRAALSGLKAGQLAAHCGAPIVTLVASDVVGDRLDVIGSGPTIATDREPLRRRAREILQRLGLGVPAVLAGAVRSGARPRDRAQLVAPLAAFARIVARELGLPLREPALTGDVAGVARALATQPGAFVAYGEPTLIVPPAHGQGGRARQLALLLARELRGGTRSAFVAGSDGVDGPSSPPVAGAFVDGATWDTIADPAGAIARCDAGTALAQIGAQFAPGPTGVNHADVVIVG
jgi:glycerate 2-kinase